MSDHRIAGPSIVGSSVPRRRRWMIGAAGALGASGLILGGLGVPVSADDANVGGKPHASATVQDGCVTATGGMDQAGGSASPQGDGAALEAAGDGTATVSVRTEDLGDPPTDDPGGALPGDLDDVLPDPEDVVPGGEDGSLAGEVVAVVTAALEGEIPGDGEGPVPGDLEDLPGGLDDVDPGEIGGVIPDGPGGSPDEPGDLVPGGLGGLVPGGSGIDVDGLLERLAGVIPGAVEDGHAPGGTTGGAPAVHTSTNGSASESVGVGGDDAQGDAPMELVLGAEIERGRPSPADTVFSPTGALPRTGGGLGNGVLRLVAAVGLGWAALGLAIRRPLADDAARD